MELPRYTKTWHNDVYPAIDASQPALSVKGKRVLISGGGSGIGAETARAFATAGASHIIVLGRTKSTLETTRNAVLSVSEEVDVLTIVVDISDEDRVSKAFEKDIHRVGPIDIFINNAAYLPDLGTVQSSKASDWWKASQINILGSFLMTQAVLNIISNDGVIVNVTSGIAHIPHVPKHSAYAVTKTASVKLFEYVQHELPELRVFNLQPGIIESTTLATKAATQSGASWPQQDTCMYLQRHVGSALLTRFRRM
jgi:NAD(P)-dependent dehydrogenase (short-subunit alcohol dehydrogenase family)